MRDRTRIAVDSVFRCTSRPSWFATGSCEWSTVSSRQHEVIRSKADPPRRAEAHLRPDRELAEYFA